MLKTIVLILILFLNSNQIYAYSPEEFPLLGSEEDNMQKLTDKYVKEIDKMIQNKETEIMTI